MSSWFNTANIYLFLWCIYSTQGVLFPKGTLITQLLLVVLLLASFYYCLIAHMRYELPVYFKGLDALLAMFVIYGVYLIIGGFEPMNYAKPIDSFDYLKIILISLLPIYAFFVLSKKGEVSEKFFYVWFFVFFVSATINYYEHYQRHLLIAMLKGSSSEEFTNNAGYEFLSLIPFCAFFYKRPVLQYVALGTCMVFLFMAMKRGAIIIGVCSLLWFIWTNLRDASFKKKIGIMGLSMVLCCTCWFFVEKRMQESFYFQKRVENTLKGDSSGRDKLYSRFIDYFVDEATPIQFTFGSGANATLKVSYNYAHNDWLEIAVNQGVMGLIIYMVYWFFFGWTVLSKKYDSHIKIALQILFVIYFMKTLFSMSYNSMGYVTMLIMGYCLAKEKKNEQVVYSN